MLVSAVIGLTPVEAAMVPEALGYAAHAWFLDRVRATDPNLATRLHAEQGPRPFTISNLWGTGRARGGRVVLDPERPCWLRVTGLTEEVTTAILRGLPPVGEALELAQATLRVTEIATHPDQHPWAGQTTYAELADRHTLATARRPRGVTLRFSSPTLFRSQGRDLPLPLPSLVFDRYLRKWNAFAPLALPEEAKRYATECIALGRFRLRSHLVSFEHWNKGAHVGFSGEAHFRFLVGDGYWTRVMALLASYAFWAGTGYRTADGLGQTRAVRREPKHLNN